MKLKKLFWVMAVMALPLGFTACGSDDEEDTTPYAYQAPSSKNNAAKFIVQGSSSVRSLVFGEGGSVVIELVPQAAVKASVATRAGGAASEYLVGVYTRDGNVYTITVNGSVWGTVEVVDAGNGNCTLVITIRNKGTETLAAIRESVAVVGTFADKLCRTWMPKKTRLTLTKPRGSAFAKQLEGCDFQEVKDYIEAQGCHIADDFGSGYTVNSIFFTAWGTFVITFKNGKNYVADWKSVNEAAGKLSYTWKDSKTMGCSYENGQAGVEFMTGSYRGECWLTLSADIKSDNEDFKVELIIRMVDKGGAQ